MDNEVTTKLLLFSINFSLLKNLTACALVCSNGPLLHRGQGLNTSHLKESTLPVSRAAKSQIITTATTTTTIIIIIRCFTGYPPSLKSKNQGECKIHCVQSALTHLLKSVQSILSHLITASVPCAMFTHFLVEHGWSISIPIILNRFTWGLNYIIWWTSQTLWPSESKHFSYHCQ